jgi:tRNA (guanine37-N1)-methyltransferase
MTWSAQVLTLFPEMFPGPLGCSLAGTALDKGLWALETLDIRDFASDKHRSVDDSPAGGGPGMVMRADVLDKAITSARQDADENWPLIYLSPRGRAFDQAKARELVDAGGVTLICGRFEGVDQRVLEAHAVEEMSVGDYVLSGGEPAAIVVLDAVIRLLPDVLGDAETLREESFERGLLEYPHYTRPQTWDGREIPEVLTSGHHGKIAAWRREQAEDLTRRRRPDMWGRYTAGRENTEVKP